MQYRIARLTTATTPDFDAAIACVPDAPERFAECEQAQENRFERFESAYQLADFLNDVDTPDEATRWAVYSIECIGRNATSGELIWDMPRLA